MSRREWKLFVEDILESVELIKTYVADIDSDNFRNDRKTQDAVVRNLEIIGEAAKNIPGDIRSKYPSVDWRGILGLRNRIVHEYFGMSLTIVWRIAQQELPKLKEQMSQILSDNP